MQVDELIGKNMELTSVMFRRGSYGKDYGMFNALLDGESISFVCGASVIMGMMFKYLSQMGIRIEQDVPIEFPEPIAIKLIYKTSANGRQYVDYE